MNRREFLERVAVGAAGVASGAGGLGCAEALEPPADDGWDAGPVEHLIPSARHDRLLLKASFAEPLAAEPRLRVDERSVPGRASDTRGRFYRFDARGLEPGRRYALRLERASGEALTETWPLATLPAPDARPARFRLLAYTCAGGPELYHYTALGLGFLPLATRRRLLARALSFQPDALIANGDHVYWDLRSRFGWAMGGSIFARLAAGRFDRAQPLLGTPNEEVLTRAFGPQIAGLYGVSLRSLPSFFLQDDHDYTENDEASEALRTFPPDAFMRGAARATQQLYYPELFLDGSRVPEAGLAERTGSLRYGRLCEALLYDCRGGLSNDADPATGDRTAGFVPPEVERWLVGRSLRSDAQHLVHVPSTPLLWTAGKWGEWYPDARDPEGVLRAGAGKPFWPDGWLAQHDRLIAAAAARADRLPLFASGDLHATAAGRILRSGDQRLDANPVLSLLCGTLGTGRGSWPSEFRGTLPRPSGVLEAEEWIAPIEENGFSLLDFEPGLLRVSLFRWTPEQGGEALDRLQPFRVLELPRPGA